MILEAATHKFNGNFERTENWIKQFSKKTEIVKGLVGGEILYYNGSNIEVSAPYGVYLNKEDN
jgi:hypothetical protein